MTGRLKGFVDHTVDPSACPHCGMEGMDGAMGVTGHQAPSDGDVSICVYCTGLSVYEGGGLRRPTTEERRKLISDERIAHARRVVRLSLERNPDMDRRHLVGRHEQD